MKRAIALLLLLMPGVTFADDKPKAEYFFKRTTASSSSATASPAVPVLVVHRVVSHHAVSGGNLTFINAGISGDTANGGAGRFKTHVLDESPPPSPINFGMNDGGYGKFNPAATRCSSRRPKPCL